MVAMTQCLNPNCSKPDNSDRHRFCQNCGWRLRLGDRYEAVYNLGSGQNSHTFVGRDRATLVQPQCLIKQFTPVGNTLLERDAAAERWRRDVEHWEIASQHPQVPDVFEYFERESHQFLVQQFLVGSHLDQRLQEKLGPFDSDDVAAFLWDVLPILHHLHQNHIIHRDIKPINFRQPPSQEHWWLVDLGAIKPLTATRMAQPGTLVGSADYVAPEQLRGDATYASDLYSLGVVCLHLLTGLQPFDLFDGSHGGWHWRSVVPDVSPRLATLIDRMVQPALRDRIPDVETAMSSLGMPPPSTPAPTPSRPRIAQWQADQTVDLAAQVVAMTPLPSTQNLLVLTTANHIEVRSLHHPANLMHTLQAEHPYGVAMAAHPHQADFVIGTRQGILTRWHQQGEHWHSQLIKTFDCGLTQVLYGPKGELVLADEQGRIHRWDKTLSHLQQTWQAHRASITSLALSHSGTILASGDTQGRVTLWDPRTGECLRTLSQHPGAITALAWLPGDRVLVTASWDVTVRWRCPKTGSVRQLANAQGFYLPVRSLLSHPTEPILVTGSQDGYQQCWVFTANDKTVTEPARAIAMAPQSTGSILTLCTVFMEQDPLPNVLSINEAGHLKRWSYPI